MLSSRIALTIIPTDPNIKHLIVIRPIHENICSLFLFSEFPSKISTRMSTRSSTTSFDTPPSAAGSQYNIEDKIRTDSTSSDPEKKKKSKLKKFFKKLSTTKKDCKVDFDLSSVDGFDHRFGGTEPCLDVHYRRCSLGGDSCHSSTNDIQPANSSPTSTSFSKRRVFNFNFASFKKKGKRNRSTADTSMFTDDVNCVGVHLPSTTVKALCSPEMGRRSKQERAAVRYSRRGSDPSLYMTQGQQPLTTHKKRQPGSSAPDGPNLLYYSHTDYTSGVNASSGSFDDDVEYANWPFSKTNVTPPTKPQRKNKGL